MTWDESVTVAASRWRETIVSFQRFLREAEGGAPRRPCRQSCGRGGSARFTSPATRRPQWTASSKSGSALRSECAKWTRPSRGRERAAAARDAPQMAPGTGRAIAWPISRTSRRVVAPRSDGCATSRSARISSRHSAHCLRAPRFARAPRDSHAENGTNWQGTGEAREFKPRTRTGRRSICTRASCGDRSAKAR